MFSIRLRPLQGYARSAQIGLGRAGVTSRCAIPRSFGLRYSSQLNKTPKNADILIQQRLRRPVSPHLSIYRPQITWIVSIATRITGVALSGGLYLYATAYLASPLFGWNIGSESLVAAFSSLSPSVQFALKFGAALPFVFHGMNGMRHLVWDTGRMLTNQQISRSGWTVVGASTVVAVLLALWKPKKDDAEVV
ncbi:Succinate dehydrogenase, cytochrome b556 subunit [Penicillium griseofulvum]|uniref:Succinate dehydrogenase, cytochrome b556 subunit n=1 Tax=Penicillium patulum TaxID=5078 RepID=A0A135LZE6_PENPA|nr:Succinate dehydrogenase, cytochrome b556 subunit [Penicillium griseofulvum]KXG54301.1 Succinate dehydrogenase, cytochrome b556 subunit [Penicillium griseofulvum]